MYLNEDREERISTIDSSKNIITLLDGSKWEAVGMYTYKLPLWIITHKVVVKKSILNFKMTNINRGETIDVKQIQG